MAAAGVLSSSEVASIRKVVSEPLVRSLSKTKTDLLGVVDSHELLRAKHRQSSAEARDLRDALIRYGRHDKLCAVVGDRFAACSCGLDETRRKLRAEP